MFTSEKQYAAFVLEREYLRGTREQGDLENDLYESSLVNDALANTYNLKTMFFGINSFPDKYEAIKSIVGEDKYLLFNYLVYDSQAIKSAGKNTIIKNLRLTGDVKDPDFLESLNSEFEELSDVTVTKVSDPMLNREISEFFQKLSVYGFMQSGMNASYLSFVPILSSNNFKDIIKTNIDEFSKVIDGENGNTALYRYNQVFEKQNSRKNNIKYRFKNYVIDSVISKMGDPIPKLPEGTSSTMTPRVYTFKYNKMGTIGYINKYSGLVGVYNGAKDGSGTNVIASDTYMGNTNKVTGTTVPLPIFESYVGKPNYLSSANAADNIKLVQDSIAQLVEMYEAGKTLLFNQDGYGIFSDDNNIDRSAYVELSKELYYNFGYLNPVFEKDPDFMEYIYSVQPINQIFNEDPETAPDQEDDIVEEKEITLIDGNNYPASAINSEMLENMGYDEDTIGEILKQICG